MYKTIFRILFLIFSLFSAGELRAGYFDDKGLISSWKFAPLQVDVGLVENRKLVDESTHTLLSFGVFILEQKSAVLSLSLLANTLQDNYGLQISPIFIGCVTDNNYGISFGFENYCKKCYGIQIGILNHFWRENKVDMDNELLQICGINIADTLYIGLMNVTEKFQIGVLNLGVNAKFQIGLLNYNHKSYIPWMPFINFDMGRTRKKME